MLKALFKITVSVFAILMIIAGLVITPTPLPLGIVMVFLGFLLLSAVAPDLVRWLRRRWRWFDRQIHRFERRAPRWLAKQLAKTDHEHADDEVDNES